MKLNKHREDLEVEIKSFVDVFATTADKSEIDLIAEHLNTKHGVKLTDIYSIFNNANNVSKLRDEELALFGEQVGLRIGIAIDEWVNEWFTQREIEEFSRYQYIDIEKFDEFEFPATFYNVSSLGGGYYNLVITKQELARMRKYGKLNYNENVQRGLKKVHRYGTDIYEPIVFHKKVDQIKKSILRGEGFPSTIVLNAAQMSAIDGVELEFNDKKGSLTIHEGTVLDIVDGMHRVLGNYAAWLENKEIEGAYTVIISNKSDEEVRLHQVDIDKTTKLLSGRIAELSNKSQMSEVINNIKFTNELRGKITSATDSKTGLRNGELFPYKILLKILEDNFKAKNTLEARSIAKQINEYNIYLFGYYGEYQTGDYSLLFDVDIYEGHLNLMQEMLKKEIPFDKLNEIIKIEDFHRENKMWEDLKLTGRELKKLNKKDRSRIIEYFKSLVK